MNQSLKLIVSSLNVSFLLWSDRHNQDDNTSLLNRTNKTSCTTTLCSCDAVLYRLKFILFGKEFKIKLEWHRVKHIPPPFVFTHRYQPPKYTSIKVLNQDLKDSRILPFILLDGGYDFICVRLNEAL